MKDGFRYSVLVLTLAASSAFSDKSQPKDTPSHFLATLQLAINESNQELTARGQRVVIEEINQVFSASPRLQVSPYEIRTTGNEVILTLGTQEDMRDEIHYAVTDMIQHLNGRVRAKGKSVFYRTSADSPDMARYKIRMDETNTRLASVSVESVPLRDILKEIKDRVGEFSYLIPGDCAARPVDWSFNENEAPRMYKTLDDAMQELATVFNLTWEKKKQTYVFKGSCDNSHAPSKRPRAKRLEKLNRDQMFGPTPTRVYFPVSLLGE